MLILKNHFDPAMAESSPFAAAIPEPGTLVLVLVAFTLIGALNMIAWVRRRPPQACPTVSLPRRPFYQLSLQASLLAKTALAPCGSRLLLSLVAQVLYGVSNASAHEFVIDQSHDFSNVRHTFNLALRSPAGQEFTPNFPQLDVVELFASNPSGLSERGQSQGLSLAQAKRGSLEESGHISIFHPLFR
jgi:hypothetical protein